jgi:hypothetical protein
MPANKSIQDISLVGEAVAWLGDQLPPSWTVERAPRRTGGGPEPQELRDQAIDLRAPNGTIVTLAVVAEASVEPRDVQRLLTGFGRTLRNIVGTVPLLVVAPWLSPRVQELLAAEEINFIDLTGNALVRLDNPAVYLRSTGTARNPQPAPRGRAQVRGPKAARLIRLLVDVRPPYGVGEIAGAAQLAPGYVSRLLDTLDAEALVERSKRGRVESVDLQGLLRRWALSYDVLESNRASSFLAPNGANDVLARLRDGDPTRRPPVVTGSFAAVRVAPVAAPALLLAYCDDVSAVARDLGLLPADEGANVALLTPFDRVVWERTVVDAGVAYAAPSQVAVDCLTGPGRMPAEGEAVLEWMLADESHWRVGALDGRGVAAAP